MKHIFQVFVIVLFGDSLMRHVASAENARSLKRSSTMIPYSYGNFIKFNREVRKQLMLLIQGWGMRGGGRSYCLKKNLLNIPLNNSPENVFRNLKQN